MIKRILIYTIILVAVFFTSYFLNKAYVDKNGVELSFSLLGPYLYQFSASLLIYIIIKGLSIKSPDNMGSSYLGLTTLRFILFMVLYKHILFSEDTFSKAEKIAMFIPWLLFSIIEGVAVVKLLNKQDINIDKIIKNNPKN